MDSSLDNSTAARPRLTDSAWFWLMLFSCMGLVALQLMDWKYNQRQAKLEQQFQGRRWAAEHGAHIEMNPNAPLENRPKVPLQEPLIAEENQSAVSAHPQYSQPGRLMISLWPLRVMAGVAICLSIFMLRKERMKTVASSKESAQRDDAAMAVAASNSNMPAERGVPSP